MRLCLSTPLFQAGAAINEGGQAGDSTQVGMQTCETFLCFVWVGDEGFLDNRKG